MAQQRREQKMKLESDASKKKERTKKKEEEKKCCYSFKIKSEWQLSKMFFIKKVQAEKRRKKI